MSRIEEEQRKVLNGVLNKVTLANLFTIKHNVISIIEDHKIKSESFCRIVFKGLDIASKVPDYQVLTFAGLAAVVLPPKTLENVILDVNFCECYSNIRNIFRMLGFLFLLDCLSIEAIRSTFKRNFVESEQRIELAIDFFQLCGHVLRKNYPTDCSEMIAFVLEKSDDSTSRGKFQREMLLDLRNNAQKLVKKIDIPELETLMKTLSECKGPASIDLRNGDNKKLSTQELMQRAILESNTVEDAKCRLAPFMLDKAFDRDFLHSCLNCVSREKIYNSFYAVLTSSIIVKRYRLKRFLRLQYSIFLKDLVKHQQLRALIYQSKFYAHFFSSGILTLRNMDELSGVKLSDKQSMVICICISGVKSDSDIAQFLDGEPPQKIDWLRDNHASIRNFAIKMKLPVPKFLD